MPQTVPVKIGRGSSVVDGTVGWFNEEEGWGALAAPEVPGGCFVHYSSIQASGYRGLRAGQSVRFTFRQHDYDQDGYHFTADEVWPKE